MNSQYPTNEVTWDQHRDLITQLYYRDGLSLSRVRLEMANKHQFKATDKMYKTRIKAWGLTKYVKHVGSTRVQKRERMARAPIAVVSSDAALQSRHYGNLAAVPGVEFGSMSIDARLSERKLVSALSESLSATSSLRRISALEKMLFLSRDYYRYYRKPRSAFGSYFEIFLCLPQRDRSKPCCSAKSKISASENPLAKNIRYL